MTLPFLSSYGGQTTAELLGLEGKYRIDSLVLAFEQGIQQKASPSTDESHVLAIEALEREVNNGGYAQFFTNSSGVFAATVESALRAFGCPKTADITHDAIAALNTNGALDAESVADAASAGPVVEAALNDCNARYFANDEPIADRVFASIKANPARVRVGVT